MIRDDGIEEDSARADLPLAESAFDPFLHQRKIRKLGMLVDGLFERLNIEWVAAGGGEQKVGAIGLLQLILERGPIEKGIVGRALLGVQLEHAKVLVWHDGRHSTPHGHIGFSASRKRGIAGNGSWALDTDDDVVADLGPEFSGEVAVDGDLVIFERDLTARQTHCPKCVVDPQHLDAVDAGLPGWRRGRAIEQYSSGDRGVTTQCGGCFVRQFVGHIPVASDESNLDLPEAGGGDATKAAANGISNDERAAQDGGGEKRAKEEAEVRLPVVAGRLENEG